jgi:hypothetical protein
MNRSQHFEDAAESAITASRLLLEAAAAPSLEQEAPGPESQEVRQTATYVAEQVQDFHFTSQAELTLRYGNVPRHTITDELGNRVEGILVDPSLIFTGLAPRVALAGTSTDRFFAARERWRIRPSREAWEETLQGTMPPEIHAMPWPFDPESRPCRPFDPELSCQYHRMDTIARNDRHARMPPFGHRASSSSGPSSEHQRTDLAADIAPRTLPRHAVMEQGEDMTGLESATDSDSSDSTDSDMPELVGSRAVWNPSRRA